MGGGGGMSPFENLTSKLKNFKPTKTNLQRTGRASCPACGKKCTDQKLSILEKEDGVVRIHCHGACLDYVDVLTSIGLREQDLYPKHLQNGNHSEKEGKVKGWDWWSIIAELEARAEDANNAFFALSGLLPKGDEARLIVAKLAGDQKEFAKRLKFGRGVK